MPDPTETRPRSASTPVESDRDTAPLQPPATVPHTVHPDPGEPKPPVDQLTTPHLPLLATPDLPEGLQSTVPPASLESPGSEGVAGQTVTASSTITPGTQDGSEQVPGYKIIGELGQGCRAALLTRSQ